MSLSSIGNAISNKVSNTIADNQTSKAMLILYYPSSQKVEVTESVSKNSWVENPEVPTIAGMSFKNGADTILGRAVSRQNNGIGGTITKVFDTTYSNTLEIPFQFNPSNINISAYGGGMRQILDFGAGENQSDTDAVNADANGNNKKTSGIRYAAMSPNITLSFSTIFDATKNSDAFVSDKINLNLTNLAKNVTDLIQGNSYSVRPVVEGLMEAVRDQDKRNARFVWGDMNYQGLLNSIQARYTMFNTKGEPIRAQVNFSLYVPLSSSITATNFWRERYNEIVGRNSNGYITVASSSASSIANSLLNLQN